MVLLSVSVTKRVPSREHTIWFGFLNLATEPFPSFDPGFRGEPQRVVTVPSGVIFLIVLFHQSTTKRVPSREAAIPEGYWNLAAEPLPSFDPGFLGEPQKVVTVPSKVTRRMV